VKRPRSQTVVHAYLLPFEVVSVLLLVAMMGVILLSKERFEIIRR